MNFSDCQAKKSKQAKAGQINLPKVSLPVAVELPQLQVDSKAKNLLETEVKSEDAVCSINLENNALLPRSSNKRGKDDSLIENQNSGTSSQRLISKKKGFPLYFLTPQDCNINMAL